MRKFGVIFLAFYAVFTYPAEIALQVQSSKTAKLEKHCPFVIGNKTFNKPDLEKLSEKHIDDLIDISNPPCCLRMVGISNNTLTPFNVDVLKGMPKKIKKGLVVQRYSYDKIIDDTRVECCTDATTCCAVAAPAVEGWAWIATGCSMSNATLWGLFCGWFGAVAAPCAVCTAYSCCEACCCKNVREEIIVE